MVIAFTIMVDTLKKWIPVLGTILCATILATCARDRALTSRHLAWCAVTLLLVLCSREIRIGKIHFFVVGYLCFALFTWQYAVNKSEWLYAVLRILLVLSYLSVVKIDEKLFSKGMILLGLIFVGYFWYDYFTRAEGEFSWCRGLMMQRNTWAAAHFFVIPFCYYAIKERFWRKLSIVVMILMVTNIILLSSRSAMLALIVSGLTIMIINRKLRPYVLVAGSISILLILYFLGDRILKDDSVYTRTEQWKYTLSMIRQNPCGVGAGNWWIVFPRYASGIDYSGAFIKEVFRFCHNDFLWVWSETGFGGIICYLGMFLFAIYSAWKKKAIYLVVALVGYMSLAFFTAPNERPFSSLMAVTFIAMSCDMKPIRQPRILLSALIFTTIVFGYRFRAACWNKKLRATTDYYLISEATQEGYSVFSTVDTEAHPWHWWHGMANLNMGRYNIAVASLQKAYEYNPYCVQVLNGMGIMHGVLGDYKNSIGYFEDALEICPKYIEARTNMEKVKAISERKHDVN